MVEPPGKLLGHPVEAGAGEDDLRPRVVDDERPFGGRQAPADRRHHDPGARRAEKEGEIEVAVLADPGDAITHLQTRGEQPARAPRDSILDTIGRASCRERVWQYVSISVGAEPLQKKNKKQMDMD